MSSYGTVALSDMPLSGLDSDLHKITPLKFAQLQLLEYRTGKMSHMWSQFLSELRVKLRPFVAKRECVVFGVKSLTDTRNISPTTDTLIGLCWWQSTLLSILKLRSYSTCLITSIQRTCILVLFISSPIINARWDSEKVYGPWYNRTTRREMCLFLSKCEERHAWILSQRLPVNLFSSFTQKD